MPIPKHAVEAYLNRNLESLAWIKRLKPLEVEEELSYIKPRPRLHCPLRTDQKILFLLGIAYPEVLFMSDLGSGKTAVSLELLSYFYENGFMRRGFVFTPTDEVCEGWEDEIKRWGFELPFVRLVGSSQDKWEQLKKLDTGIAIGTYMGISAMVSKLALKAGTPKVWNKRDPNVPKDAVYIGRGSIAGNPFVIGEHGGRDDVCNQFENYVESRPDLKEQLVEYCKGKHLVCFCKPERCHGDYLLAISNPKPKRERQPLARLVLGATKDVDAVVFDQSTKLGSQASLSFAVCKEFALEAQLRFGLAGRAFGRDPFVLWSQLYLVDRGKALGTSPGMFREAFWRRVRSPWGTSWTIRKRREPQLAELIAASSIRYSIEECVDLPPKVYLKKECSFPEENWAYYDQVVGELLAAKGNYREIKNTFLKMRQISSGFVGFKDDETGEKAQIEFEVNPKLDLLMQLVEEVPDDKKLVIFYEYTWSGARICQELTKAKLRHGWLWSGTKDWTKIKVSFNGDPDFRFLVSNWKKGSMGLNLQTANYLAFYESPVSSIDRYESEGRIYRTGQKHKSMIYDLLVKGSADHRILELHEEGDLTFKALVEDPAKYFSRRT